MSKRKVLMLIAACGLSMTVSAATLVLPMTASRWSVYASGGVIKCGVSVCGTGQPLGVLPNGAGVYFDFPVAPDLPIGAFVIDADFVGVGLNDIIWNEWPTVTSPVTYCAVINGLNVYKDAAGLHDSVSWGTDAACTNRGTARLYSPYTNLDLTNGNIFLNVDSPDGHTLGDKWTVSYGVGTQSTDWRGYLMAVPGTGKKGVALTNTQVLTMTVEVLTTGAPVFGYHGDGDYDCIRPVTIRPHFQRGPWEKWVDDSYRWWAKEPYSFTLVNGSATISIPLHPQYWIQTWGKTGNATPTLLQAFNQSISAVGAIGAAIGGGCSYGHGANVSGGTARLVLKSYTVQ